MASAVQNARLTRPTSGSRAAPAPAGPPGPPRAGRSGPRAPPGSPEEPRPLPHEADAADHQALGVDPVEAGGDDHVAHRDVGPLRHVLEHQVLRARLRAARPGRRRLPRTRLRSTRTPAPPSRSRSTCTRAARGPTANTRPTTPVGLITGSSSATPSDSPLSMVRLRNQGTPSRATTWAASGLERHRLAQRRAARAAARPPGPGSSAPAARSRGARTRSSSRRFSR